MKASPIFFLLILSFNCFGQQDKLPDGFVHVKDIIPDIILDIRYAGENNFIGQPVTGYKKPTAILTRTAAKALAKVQEELKDAGYCLKIFDAYRPQRAVDHFVKWARMKDDTLKKQEFYPEIPKNELFSRGYISSKSGHSRGSTVDLSLVDADTGEDIDMGGNYDFFGMLSHHDTEAITPQQRKNRQLLRTTMRKYGFVAYQQEWWHYTLQPEPYPNTFFDFPVE